MRAPFELACSPSAASSAPALTSSSLSRPPSERIFSAGRTPASDSLLALTSSMKRIFLSPKLFRFTAWPPAFVGRIRTTLYSFDEQACAKSTRRTNFFRWADAIHPPSRHRREGGPLIMALAADRELYMVRPLTGVLLGKRPRCRPRARGVRGRDVPREGRLEPRMRRRLES